MSFSSAARILAAGAWKRGPCPDKTHSKSYARSFSIERVCSAHEYQHTTGGGRRSLERLDT
jgi:hypothetical protein